MSAAVPASVIKSLLKDLLPRGGLMVALAKAYFDDSGSEHEPWPMCIGGYVFRPGMAEQLEPKWQDMLFRYKLPYFRMSECEFEDGPNVFSHLSSAQRSAVAREAIALIVAHADQGFAISIDNDVSAALRDGSMWDNTYSFLCGQTVHAIQEWANRTAYQGDVAYIFESGTKGYGQALEALGRIKEADGSNTYRIRNMAVVDKRDAAGVQCADILAWHWLKQHKRWSAGLRGRRGDFRALSNGVFVSAHHYDVSAVYLLQSLRAHWRAQGE